MQGGTMYSATDNAQVYRARRPEKHQNRSLVPPCQAACPLHMDIREYVDLVAQGRIMEALQVIRNGNPFPSICAYVCTHPCEEACRRTQVDNPVAIRALKRFAVEFGGDRMVQAEAENTHQRQGRGDAILHGGIRSTVARCYCPAGFARRW